MKTLPNGFVVVVKEDCPTCVMVIPALQQIIEHSTTSLTIFTQDNPDFPAEISNVNDDSSLEFSFHHAIETVPTLIHVENGTEVERIVGWSREMWREFTGIQDLGADLPEHRPGCGSKSVEPGIVEALKIKFGTSKLHARRVELASLDDDIEACFDRGWSDGLPVVPPTEVRVLRMLEGTTRAPDEIVAIIPPNNIPCTVEKIAINAVMAGCKPEYLPVVITAVEAVCDDVFCMHGLLATTYFSSPVVIVNGAITKAIGMNSGVNALGQGNRANATIGRALQLIIRNVGGGIPDGVDRSALGNPGKYTFCFAENEYDSAWESLAVERGFSPDASTVTVFAGDGVQGFMDQLSRTPESLTKSLAMALQSVCHPKLAMVADALLVLSPEHMRIYGEAGWSKVRFRQELLQYTMTSGEELIRGAQGVAEGMPEMFAQMTLPKFRENGLQIVHAGGSAGLFSAIIGGWPSISAEAGSQPVTKEIVL